MESIAALLKVFNKPVHFFFIGLAIILFAPETLLWTGYVFLAGTAASGVEAIYNKIKSILKIKKDKQAAEKTKREKQGNALIWYDDLNKFEKNMVDHCIINNEWVYEGSEWHKKHVKSLAIKGFGQESDFGRAIIFNGDTYLTVLKLMGEKIKESYQDNSAVEAKKRAQTGNSRKKKDA